MDRVPTVQPLPLKNRQRFFWVLLFIFACSLPFLYLSATGYRFELGKETNIVSTGGMYIASDRTGAEIYIDGELVRETRPFRRAFYAQNIEPGTHRVHVQKEDHHTWVKELPVSPRLVTEAQAFNLPLVPQLRVIAEWQTATGSQVVRTPMIIASTTNEIVATTTPLTKKFAKNTEYALLRALFVPATTTATSTGGLPTAGKDLIERASSTDEEVATAQATSTKESGGVRLLADGDEVYARWVGSREQMPYYYCAATFAPYGTSSETFSEPAFIPPATAMLPAASQEEGDMVIVEYTHPLQTQSVPADAVCDPLIKMDRRWQQVTSFDFMPGSTDFVVLALADGVYAVEIDNRSWQNMQPLLLGTGLDFRIQNGLIFVYDGTLVYQIFPKY